MNEPDDVSETVLRERYLLRDQQGSVTETPDELFERVAGNLARAEELYDGDPAPVKDSFYRAMADRRFLPNSPTLMNAGTTLQQLAACFVLPVDDSLASIFETLKDTALIHQSGGGTGFSFSRLRPRGDVVKETGGVASGPVSFMKIFDAATEQIKQGGKRRGANMAVLNASHPDVEEFVNAKEQEGVLRNFNCSVMTDAAFWEAYRKEQPYQLVNPRTGEAVSEIAPRRLLEQIARLAWETGDPGILFSDTINRANPTPNLGPIRATNPCGEVPLLPYEACVLGSVNLATMSGGDGVQWDQLRDTVHLGVRMLDNAIDMSRFPVDRIDSMMSSNRKIGLGVMGFHDLLVDQGIPYDSDRAVSFAERIMQFVSEEAWNASENLAEQRGPFPNWRESVLDRPVRNATTTTIAPTGTISLIAGCSSGIEPIYGVSYTKHVMGGLEIVNQRFVDHCRRAGCYTEKLMGRVEDRTTIQDLTSIPESIRELFQTAHDIPPGRHVQIQAAFQQHVDNAVSKTVNLPADSSIDDVMDIFLQARNRQVKGITVFRSGSRREQVLGSDPLKEECVSECDYAGPRMAPDAVPSD